MVEKQHTPILRHCILEALAVHIWPTNPEFETCGVNVCLCGTLMSWSPMHLTQSLLGHVGTSFPAKTMGGIVAKTEVETELGLMILPGLSE